MDKLKFPSDVFSDDFNYVYEPNDDTAVLIDAMLQDIDLIKSRRPLICVEVGCGSGAVITSVAKALSQYPCTFFTTDINPRACETAKKCTEVNGVNGIQIVMNKFTTSLEDRLKGSVDLLIFNPPFFPSDPNEIGVANRWGAEAAGQNGRSVMDTFIKTAAAKLMNGKNAFFYMAAIRSNDPDDIIAMANKYGLNGEVVLERKWQKASPIESRSWIDESTLTIRFQRNSN